MKSISGKVVSSKPISLSKAARTLSNFVSVDNGASQAVSAYLRRASASFDYLVHFKKELKVSHSGRKHNKHRSVDIKNEDQTKTEQKLRETEEEFHNEFKASRSDRKHKKHRSVGFQNENPIKTEQNHREAEEDGVENVEDSLKHEKHRHVNISNDYPIKTEQKSIEFEEGRVKKVDDSVRKRARKRKSEDLEREGGGYLGIEEEKRKEKKMKRGEVDDREVFDSTKQSGLKKKKKGKIETGN